MIKETIYKNLEIGDRFNVAFPDGIPANSNIDKSKTASGITYSEMNAARHTIIVTPYVPIIEDKCDVNNEDYAHLTSLGVTGGITSQMVADYLSSNTGHKWKKILITPEGFKKVIDAAIIMKKPQWLYDEFFLFLDEAHCYAVDGFRDDILIPFNYIDYFKNWSMGTATPFPYTHPRFKKLDNYEVTYKEKFGEVTIVNEYNPKAVLNHFLRNPDIFPGNVFIYYNTVLGTGEAIINADITDENFVNVYCREEERNMINLGEAQKFFKNKPVKGDFKKFNFFTGRYYEGWDLHDDETATMVLVTDKTVAHSLIGIPYKGFQAVGRLRTKQFNKPNKIYHITNNFRKPGMKTIESIQSTQLYNAQLHIDQFNSHKAECKRDGVEDLEWLLPVIKPFAKFEHDQAVLNEDLLDRISCAAYCREMYNNIASISKMWESCNYDTIEKKFDLAPLVRVKTSQEDVNKQVIDHIEELKANPEQYVYEVASQTVKNYKIEFTLLIEAYEILGKREIERLGYNNEAMKAELINRSNQNAEAKLRLMLIDEFKLNERYTNKYIKDKLRRLYDLLGIKQPNGLPKTAFANQLGEFGLFKVNECKAIDEHGKTKPGFEIVKIYYSLKMAA